MSPVPTIPGAVAPGVAVGLAFALDAVVAEPPRRLHPVAWFGSLVAVVDREWTRPRLAGVAVAVAAPLLAAIAVGLAVVGAARFHPVAGVVAAGLVVFVTTSLRMLVDTAREVVAATASDLPAARERLRWLAGRDAGDLSAGEVRSAAVESAAENLADGAVAGLLAFALFAPIALPLGAGAAAWVKAVNTLDSTLGYPDVPHGTASARLDDLVMWVPARASAVFLAAAAFAPGTGSRRGLGALSAAREWAHVPSSPNSGWPMATLAAILDARLEKPGVYVLDPDASLPSVETARTGVRVVELASVLAFVLAGVVSVAGSLAGSLLAGSLAGSLAGTLPGVVAWA